jgi:guanine nucleotide-binding protein alpha-1 subunit
VKLNEFMISYGDRPNDYDSVSKCKWGENHILLSAPSVTLGIDFRNKFGGLNQSYSQNKARGLYSKCFGNPVLATFH